MVATIQQIIGKVNPKFYAENGKELLKKYKSTESIPAEEIKPKPLSEHVLVYDSTSETLEPIYFFIVDLINNLGFETEKLVDNFVSSPGSGHFAELGQRATIMQQQATKILGDVNAVLRSTLNIIYDLRDFKIRLQYYNDLKSKEKGKNEAALLSLKQIWIDKVDAARGNSSIKIMSFQGGFQTLLDAFLVIKDEKEADKLDLNERVKRILKQRITEFNIWLKNSEQELRKRYGLERTYLKSQVNSLKLYSRWVKPYLKAALQLEMKEPGRTPDLVKTFNTIILELTLFGKSKIDIKKSIDAGDLPEKLEKKSILKTLKRDYYSCILIDFYFRGIPQRIAQQPHYVFGGKTEVTFRAYALNDDELKKFEEELKKSELEDVLKLMEGATTESLEKLQEDINLFLEEEELEKKEIKDTSNPFLALLGRYEKSEKQKKELTKEIIKIKPENFIEKEHLRKLAGKKAMEKAFDIFDVYKKAHGMVSYT